MVDKASVLYGCHIFFQKYLKINDKNGLQKIAGFFKYFKK